MLIDFGGCYVIESACKYLFADLEPREMITRGRERREERRVVQAEQARIEAKAKRAVETALGEIEKKKV